MKPEVRTDKLLAQEVGDEVIVYDEVTNEAHRLNRTAAIVWRLSDGSRTIPEIASALRETVDTPEAESLVDLSLAELEKNNLLLAKTLPFNVGDIITRRRMITAAAALLPVVSSIVAPTPAMAQGLSRIGFPPLSSSSSGGVIITPSSSSSAPPSSSSSSSPSSSSSSPSSSSSSPSSSSSSPSSSSASGPNFPAFNGTWVGSGTATENGCNFNQVAALQAALTLNAQGQGSWVKTHTASSTVFAYNNISATGVTTQRIRVVTQGQFNVGGTVYTVTDDVTYSSDGSATGTQTFVSGNCRVVYNLTFVKR